METEIQLRQGVLTITFQLQGFSLPVFVFGFIQTGDEETQEIYGGCDLSGAEALSSALLNGSPAFVTDPASFPWHARVIWDPYSGTLTLRAAGESADLKLNSMEQRMVANFLTSSLQAFNPRPDGQPRLHEEIPAASPPAGQLRSPAFPD